MYLNAICNTSLFCFFFFLVIRCHSSSKLDASYDERKFSKEFEDLTLDELEVIATLGMGGFGRVELVIAYPMPFFRWRDSYFLNNIKTDRLWNFVRQSSAVRNELCLTTLKCEFNVGIYEMLTPSLSKLTSRPLLSLNWIELLWICM